jgi:hypothetical protein
MAGSCLAARRPGGKRTNGFARRLASEPRKTRGRIRIRLLKTRPQDAGPGTLARLLSDAVRRTGRVAVTLGPAAHSLKLLEVF